MCGDNLDHCDTVALSEALSDTYSILVHQPTLVLPFLRQPESLQRLCELL